jgi:hypothetical protein
MAKASDNQFPKVTFLESAAPSTPASGLGFVYEKSDGKLYFKNDGGTETELTAAGGPGTFRGCTAVRTTDQTGIVTATDTPIALNGTDELDTDAFHDPASNNTRITIPSGLDGKYIFYGNLIWDTNATGIRQAQIRKNGTTAISVEASLAVTGTLYSYNMVVTPPIALSAADYMELVGYQTSGANRIASGSVVTIRFGCQRIGS